MRSQQEFNEELQRRKQQALAQRRSNRKKIITACISLALCAAVLAAVLLRPATVKAANLMEGITPNRVTGTAPDDTFTQAQLAFGLKLFQASFGETGNGNALISPLSVSLALAMTANGSGGQTKAEMETVLGMSVDDMNRYYLRYVNQLPASKDAKLSLANSIWFRDSERLQVNRDFLQTNADYYGAGAYASPFDAQTVKDINNWTKQNTDGMVDKIVEEISEATMLYLINALVFDAKWENPYKEDIQLYDGAFTAANGDRQTAKMMRDTECWYLHDSMATGFAKDYAGGDYRFVALLPNEGISIEDYVASVTAESLWQTLNSMEKAQVYAAMPQFSYDYQLDMSRVLSQMGMPRAFDAEAADLTPMATCDLGNLYIGQVLHKTHITVDTQGTRAAAVTAVEVLAEGAAVIDYSVVLDRPFLYMIVDTQTNLPVFMGTLLSLEG